MTDVRARLPALWVGPLTDPPVEGSCEVYADGDTLRFEYYDADANSGAGGWDQVSVSRQSRIDRQRARWPDRSRAGIAGQNPAGCAQLLLTGDDEEPDQQGIVAEVGPDMGSGVLGRRRCVGGRW